MANAPAPAFAGGAQAAPDASPAAPPTTVEHASRELGRRWIALRAAASETAEHEQAVKYQQERVRTPEETGGPSETDGPGRGGHHWIALHSAPGAVEHGRARPPAEPRVGRAASPTSRAASRARRLHQAAPPERRLHQAVPQERRLHQNTPQEHHLQRTAFQEFQEEYSAGHSHGAESRGAEEAAPQERSGLPEMDPPPPPRPRHTAQGTVGRLGVLAVLGAVTIVAPVFTHVPSATTASAALSSGGTTVSNSSLTESVLGSDADVDPGTDPGLSNVPDAATLARIREAYTNAAVTCAAQPAGASGDTTAFTTAPELYIPMITGTYALSSPYGYRIHPTLGTLKLHAGQDMSAAAGTPIYAAAAGTVVTAGMIDGTGTVTIEHTIDGQTWYTSYLHMYEDGIYVKQGDVVAAGQLIASVGSSGRSTGPHLHFEVRTANDGADETTVDPQAWLVEHKAAELTTDCT